MNKTKACADCNEQHDTGYDLCAKCQAEVDALPPLQVATPESAMALLSITRVFPLQTIQSMAKRWGVTNSLVSNWKIRHKDFPKEIVDIVEKTPGTPRLFPLFEVERYEQARGLKPGGEPE